MAAVAASKLSTFYHRTSILGTLPFDWTLRKFRSFPRAFFSADEVRKDSSKLRIFILIKDSRAARVFMLLCVPGHIFFNWVISLLHSQSGQYVQGPMFTALYLTAALAQVYNFYLFNESKIQSKSIALNFGPILFYSLSFRPYCFRKKGVQPICAFSSNQPILDSA